MNTEKLKILAKNYLKKYSDFDKFQISNHKTGVDALACKRPDGKFVVISGSKVSEHVLQSMPDGVYKLRQKYIKNGCIDSNFRLTEDIEFNASSPASSFVLCSSTNGNKTWTKTNEFYL